MTAEAALETTGTSRRQLDMFLPTETQSSEMCHPTGRGLNCAPRVPANLICWSKMQAEGGQPLEVIVQRKEAERKAGNGLFFWGIGNALGSAVQHLRTAGRPIPVKFSRMLSVPKLADSAPSAVSIWLSYIDEDGVEVDLPSHALITSRAQTAKGDKTRHYALVCYSDAGLELRERSRLDHTSLRNYAGTGGKVGPSQVTSLVVPTHGLESAAGAYSVDLEATLVAPYFVKLTRPAVLTQGLRHRIESWAGGSQEEWRRLVLDVRTAAALQFSST